VNCGVFLKYRFKLLVSESLSLLLQEMKNRDRMAGNIANHGFFLIFVMSNCIKLKVYVWCFVLIVCEIIQNVSYCNTIGVFFVLFNTTAATILQ